MTVVASVKPVPLGEPIVARGKRVLEGAAWGLPPGDRAAMAAARLAADALGGDLVALSVAPRAAEPGLREALALGAARAVLLEAPEDLDMLPTARALADAARLLKPRIVVAADASGDAAQGLVGPALAELLGLEMVSRVERLQRNGEGLQARRAVGSHDETFDLRPPLLLSVSARFTPSGHATSWGVGAAFERPLEVRAVAAAERGTQTMSLARADAAKAEAERLEGDADEAAAQLARRLRALGVAR